MAKITDIKEQVGDKTRVNIFIDGEFTLGLSASAAAALKLKTGMEIEPEKLAGAAQTDSAYAKALNYLSFRARSGAEIKRYLLEKEFSCDAADAVINKLTLNDYINDEEFALSIARSYGLKEGKKGVRSRLIMAGIADSIINGVLDYDEMPGALKMAEKYLRTREFDKEKLWRHLYTKGFSSDTISRAVEAVQQAAQNEENE